MANGHGGTRPGAGRKPASIRERYDTQVTQAEDEIAADLTDVIDNLRALANGEAKITVSEYAAAATILIDVPATYDNGQPLLAKNGQQVKKKELAFPKLPPEQMVLVSQKVTELPPSDKVLIYLADRILGKAPVVAESDDLTRAEIAEIIKRHVSDTNALQAIAAELEGITSTSDGAE